MVDRLKSQGISDLSVLSAMQDIPRHCFVDEALAHKAYEDTPLPIGFGQTISQPYIVARMSELAHAVKDKNRVLEIGTGCGYQTAILSKLFGTTFSVERIKALLTNTRMRLADLGVRNVYLRHSDGRQGIPKNAPYDVILLTAATSILPETLLSQLAPGGRIIFPAGEAEQRLCVMEKNGGAWSKRNLEKVYFVPLLSGVI